jgi:hypothetical protein
MKGHKLKTKMDKNMQIWANTRQLVAKNFDISPQIPDTPDEAELLSALCHTVGQMLEQAPERLFAILYRLDVSERQVQAALSPQAILPPNEGIARLIIAREKQKAITKAEYQSPTIISDDDAELW